MWISRLLKKTVLASTAFFRVFKKSLSSNKYYFSYKKITEHFSDTRAFLQKIVTVYFDNKCGFAAFKKDRFGINGIFLAFSKNPCRKMNNILAAKKSRGIFQELKHLCKKLQAFILILKTK